MCWAGCRYTAAAEVLARLCDDAECRRVVLYPKNTDRLIRTVMQWVEAGPAPSLPITVVSLVVPFFSPHRFSSAPSPVTLTQRALSVCRVLAPLCWYSEAVRAVFDKHGIPRLILKTADTSKTWLTAVAL